MTTTPHPSRRLLDPERISVKLGQPHDWFENYRGSLEAIGFPLPCLPADQFGAELWDERAIDLWLDARLPNELRQISAPRSAPARLSENYEQKLNQRARELRL